MRRQRRAGPVNALLQHADAKNPHALERIGLAKRRIQSILDRETVAHQKTLEQKIRGPVDMRVDPHLVGLAIMDLLALNRRAKHKHEATHSAAYQAAREQRRTAAEFRMTLVEGPPGPSRPNL